MEEVLEAETPHDAMLPTSPVRAIRAIRTLALAAMSRLRRTIILHVACVTHIACVPFEYSPQSFLGVTTTASTAEVLQNEP